MKNFKKIILGSASIVAVAAPLIAVVSCGTKKYLSDSEMMKLSPKEVSADRTSIVIDKGELYDGSFNEQAANALKTIRKINTPGDIDKKLYDIPIYSNVTQMMEAYESAASRGNTTILAPGYVHAISVESYIRRKGNKLNFIIADGEVKAGNVASIKFDARRPAFLAGYSVGKYLSERYKKLASKRVVGLYGGNDNTGVTDIMIGFTAGIKYWNDHCDATNAVEADRRYPIQFAKFATDEDMDKMSFTDNGFDRGGGATPAKELFDGGAKVILPVVGEQTQDVLEYMKKEEVKTLKLIEKDKEILEKVKRGETLSAADFAIFAPLGSEDEIYDELSKDGSTPTPEQIKNAQIKAFEKVIERLESRLQNMLIGVDIDQTNYWLHKDENNLAYASMFLTSILKNVERGFEEVHEVISNHKQEGNGIYGFGKTTIGTMENKLVGLVDTPITHDVLDETSQVSIASKANEDELTWSWDDAYKYIRQNEKPDLQKETFI